MRYGLYDARGRDFPVIDRFATYWGDTIAELLPAAHFHLPAPDDKALRALGLMGVAHLIQDPRNKILERPGLRLVYEGDDARIYRNERALPRAFLVERQRVAATEDDARAAVESAAFDARTLAVTERAVAGLPSRGPRGTAPGSAAIASYAPERVVVVAKAARPSLLVLTDSYFPGLGCRVDGKRAKIHRVDYLLRGVSVPPGRHRVTFDYRPASFRLGLLISVAALLLTLTTVSVASRRGRQR